MSNRVRCYWCNRSGHFSKDCHDSGSVRSTTFIRGGGGSGKIGGREKNCFKCSASGHIARDCKDKYRCYRCDGVGHIAKDCSQPPNKEFCFNCRKSGHVDSVCTNARVTIEAESNCGEQGHLSRECSKA